MFILQVNTVQCVDFGVAKKVHYDGKYHDENYAPLL